VLTEKEVTVVKGGGVDVYYEVVGAGSRGWDIADLEAELCLLAAIFCIGLGALNMGKHTDSRPSLASPRPAGW